MKYKSTMKYFLALCLIFLAFSARAQLAIHIQSLPGSTPEGADIYLAGNINGWNPGDPEYLLEIREEQDYWIDSINGTGTFEFKFTRGSWETVEGNADGKFRPNRTYTFGQADTLHLDILSWEDLDGGGGSGTSTANAQVQVWKTAMNIPQLDRTRRIWVYLPQDYENSGKSYPVLYMHDGQNVFDASTSFAGEWNVDETLTRLENQGYASAIVVAIDNGGTKRIDEYSPFTNPDYGGGEGDAYLDFIIETLKPAIDNEFRTLTGPDNTGIIGSSMGGLISHYACFRNPEVFGRIGVFSPAYWFSTEYYTYSEQTGRNGSQRIYLLAGGQETTIAQNTEDMYSLLSGIGFGEEELTVRIVPNGQHAEWFWASEFQAAFLWLFEPEQVGTGIAFIPEVRIFPNPTSNMLRITGKGTMNVKIFGPTGILLVQSQFSDRNDIDLTGFGSNLFFVRIGNNGNDHTYKIVKHN